LPRRNRQQHNTTELCNLHEKDSSPIRRTNKTLPIHRAAYTSELSSLVLRRATSRQSEVKTRGIRMIKQCLPPNTYKPLTKGQLVYIQYDLDEGCADGSLRITAQRKGELGLPYLVITLSHEDKALRRQVSFPLEYIYNLKDAIDELIEECEDRKIV
jgi:hypothetical protein